MLLLAMLLRTIYLMAEQKEDISSCWWARKGDFFFSFFTCLLATKEDQESNSLAGDTRALGDGIGSAMFSSSPLLGTRCRKCHAGRLACDIYYKLLANGGHWVHWISDKRLIQTGRLRSASSSKHWKMDSENLRSNCLRRKLFYIFGH